MNIDMRSVVFLSVIIFITCTLFIVQLWRQNRSRYAGLNFLVLDFTLQTSALTLIVLRGIIPDWISIVLSNFMVILGSIAGYIGLLLFVDKKSSQIHNYIMLLCFTFVHIYFTFITPSLHFRNLNISINLLFICLQCSILLLFRVKPDMKPLTFWPGIFFTAYCVISIIRITDFFLHVNIENDYFRSGLFLGLIQISLITLFLMLTYSLVIMVNKRLLADIALQEEKFSKAFHSAPYAITLTRMADGTVFDINEKFTTITGYEKEEVIGNRTLELNIFTDENDRTAIVEALTKTGRVSGMDIHFRKKTGEFLFGNLSAETIRVNGEQCILASIADITLRKKGEDKIKDLLSEKELILKEVHHRIKNNMNTINALLNIQASSLKDPAAITALEDAGSRLQSMMVLYDRLYKSENILEVPADKYLPDLAEQIVLNFPNSRTVKIETRIDDFILDVKVLSSLGIIINELITNAMKYAFKDMTSGVLTISAEKNDSRVRIIIQDNGIGVPESVTFENSTGFGFNLVDMLTKQLNGTLKLERGNGSKFILEFEV